MLTFNASKRNSRFNVVVGVNWDQPISSEAC